MGNEPAIIGEKIVLRLLREDEVPQIVEWRNDPAISHNFFRPHVELPEYAEDVRRMRMSVDEEMYAITSAGDGRLVGMICYEMCEERGVVCAKYGIMVGDPESRGKGFGSEAIRLLSQHLSETRGVRRVILEVIPTNEGALEFYKKLGFEQRFVVMTREITEDKI